MIRLRSLAILLLILQMAFPVLAAESSKDVAASKSLKATAREKILGAEAKRVPTEPEYVIGHGDILDVRVYGEGSMAVSAPSPPRTDSPEDTSAPRSATAGIQVRIDGRISLKNIGDVEAVGMTLPELADYLKVLYSTVYDDPIVTVVLIKSNSQRYTVMGKVVRPGVYYLDSPLNVVQVVARCGGFTEWANSKVTVVRKDGGKHSKLFDGNTLEFDYGDFLSGKHLEKNIEIKSGDIIIVH